MPHRASVRAGHRGDEEIFALGRETSGIPRGVGEPRFRAGQGVSRQPTNFALALSDFESDIQPLVLRARRRGLQDELESGRLLGVSIRGRGLTGSRARLLRRKLTTFGTVTNPRGTSRSAIQLPAALQDQAFRAEFGSSAGRFAGEFGGQGGSIPVDPFIREFGGPGDGSGF